MWLLHQTDTGDFELIKFKNQPASYAVLSHTWGDPNDEVTFDDIKNDTGRQKPGFQKILFCANMARADNLEYFWVDTCCINKTDPFEVSESIASMYRWYSKSTVCFVYLSDVGSLPEQKILRNSRWFRRGWTLQELLAPRVVRFFNSNGKEIGTKETKVDVISMVTGIPVAAILSPENVSSFVRKDRLKWAQGRKTERKEDEAYCLLGVLDVGMYIQYGERGRAMVRLRDEVKRMDRLGR